MDNISELEYEKQRLEQVIILAKNQLNQAKHQHEDSSVSIVSLRQEMRDHSSQPISGAWDSQNFEDLVEMSQFENQIKNKIASTDRIAKEIVKLERLINSPYFARIDFKFDDEDHFNKIYIGRHSLIKDSEIVVYDWRSPIASIFYRFGMGQAFYEAPVGKITGEVNLKRQFEINKGALAYYFEADVQIIDEFMRKMLSQNASSKMKSIVETIQKEQDAVIRDMEYDLMMVQGVAGSGKTSIALHRAAYLMYQGLSVKLSAHNIIIISPNTLFEQYIYNVLPDLGEDNVVSVVFEEILMKILQDARIQTRNQFIEQLITNTKYKDVIKYSMEFKSSYLFLEILNRFIDDIPRRWIAFADVFYDGKCIVSKEIIKEKILSGRNETPLGLKLSQLEDSILESLYDLKKKRINHAIVKKEMQKFTDLNVEDLYKKLMRDKNYFYQLSEGLDLPDCIEDILNFTDENLNTGYLYYDDAAVIAFLKLKIYGFNEYKNIKQVVIDEAQDYYPLHYEIINLLFSKAKYTIVGDINQTLEKQEDLSLYEQISTILNKPKSILVTMNKSFRCTNEILSYSSKFYATNEKIKSFNRRGDEPQICVAADQLSLSQMIISEIAFCLERGYQLIGLICKNERNALSLFECLKDRVDVQIIINGSTADLHGILIIPVYMSKGLEFDAVIICDADKENYHSEGDKKLLYIACTRALHRLNLFCRGEASPLL